MSYALVTGGGSGGRYSIQIDYGENVRTAILAALQANLARIEVDIATVQNKLDAQQEQVDQWRLQLQQSIATQVQSIQSSGPVDQKSFEIVRSYYAQALAATDPLQRLLDALKFDRQSVQRDIAKWTAFNPIETRQAWCVDYTEDAAGYVATLDINGESDLVVLAPGCRAWTPADGVMTAREMQAPHQVYLNAALLPGWQKFRPTYRWGTLTDINYDENTGTVVLAEARSSAQRLDINQATTLTNVPIVYMTCNAGAFQLDDRVVVKFLGQDWSQPRVVGFLDNPRTCQKYFARYEASGWFPGNPDPPSTQLLVQQDKRPTQSLDTVIAPSPQQPSPFIGWRTLIYRLTNSGLEYDSTTITRDLAINHGLLGKRLIYAQAKYTTAGARLVTKEITSVVWTNRYTIEDPITHYIDSYGSIRANFAIAYYELDKRTQLAASSVSVNDFKRNVGDADDPYFYSGLYNPLIPLAAELVPSFVLPYTSEFGDVFTFTYTVGGVAGYPDRIGTGMNVGYTGTAADRLTP